MNNSWKNNGNNTNTSGGFVYFNTSNSYPNEVSSPNSVDSPDFLSFGSDTSTNGSSPYGNNFSPSSCSSPRNHFNGKSPRGRGRGGRNYYSPIKQNGNNQFSWRKNMGLAGNSNRDNEQYHNQHSQNHNQHSQNRKTKFDRMSNQNSGGRSAFFEPTCLRDPWSELEQKLSKEQSRCSPQIENKASIENRDVDCEEILENASSGNSGSEEDSSEEMENSFS